MLFQPKSSWGVSVGMGEQRRKRLSVSTQCQHPFPPPHLSPAQHAGAFPHLGSHTAVLPLPYLLVLPFFPSSIFFTVFFFFIARKQECHAVESHKTLVMLCLSFNCVFSFVTLWTFLVSSHIFMGFLRLCLVLLCTFCLSSFPSSVIVFPVLISYTFSR